MSSVKNIVINLLIVTVSSISMLAMGEFTMRRVFDEIDYLRPELVPHNDLRYTVAPYSSGHDAWGFRNQSLPSPADVVAIGDSMTYGVSATSAHSWPAWLASMSGRNIYNLSLGGYGLGDYEWLLRNKASALKPKLVLIGIYLGNDLTGASGAKQTNPLESKAKAIKKNSQILILRDYLSRKSMLYQVTKHNLKRLSSSARLLEKKSTKKMTIMLEAKHIQTVLELMTIGEFLNEADTLSNMAEALSNLDKIMRVCDESEFECSFVVIPTKPSVYLEAAMQALSDVEKSLVMQQVNFEGFIRQQVTSFCQKRGYVVIDVLSAMRKKARSIELYSSGHDVHPNAKGYNVIAETINQRISK
ncbi:MAG: lysophospholipase L1-like esterase [Arenicella sp.]|jgi:lysophospholipase L1-like esterase